MSTPTSVFLRDPAAPATALCADIGGSFIKFGQAFGPGQVQRVDEVPTPADNWPALVQALTGLSTRWNGPGAAVPLAISTTGLFDHRNGTVNAANIPAFKGHDVAGELAAALARPVVIANDADTFALAEANLGIGRGHDVVFCAILGTGVGGALVVDGRTVRGHRGVTGEWGHGPITQTRLTLRSGETLTIPRFACGCGQIGCTDTIGGARGIERLHSHLHGQEQTSHEILDGWEAGDATAARTVEVYLALLSEPLAFAVNITGASVVPVGGGLAARTALIAALDAQVRTRTLNSFAEPLVRPGQFLDNGGLIGMSVLVQQTPRA
jgi:N-acetylglucosamine kinase